MKNVMTIDGQKAVVAFDPEIGMFRGEFTGLSGGADFYAEDVAGLQREGAISLRVYPATRQTVRTIPGLPTLQVMTRALTIEISVRPRWRDRTAWIGFIRHRRRR